MTVKHRIIPTLTPQQIERFWSKVNVAGSGECWDWKPEPTNDKPGVSINNNSYRASRVAYKLRYGVDPGDSLVCHSCDRPRCCAPHHLFLGTSQDNVDDCVSKGRQNKGVTHHKAKLTENDIQAIRARYACGDVSMRTLGQEYGVATISVGRVLKCETHISANGYQPIPTLSYRVSRGELRPTAKLTEDQVRTIRARYAAGGISRRALALEYSVDHGTIRCVVTGKTWKHI